MGLNELIQIVGIFTDHYDFLLGGFGDVVGYFSPDRVEEHGRVDKDQPTDNHISYLLSMRGKYLTILPMTTCKASITFLEASCINLPFKSTIHTTCSPSCSTYSAN